MSKPSVFYVITSMNRGGAETHLWRVLPDLKDKGYKITIVTIREKGELAKAFEAKNIKIIGPAFTFPKNSRLGIRLWYLFRVLQLFFCLLYNRPNIVHFFLPEGYLIGGFSAYLAMLPNRVMSRRSLNNYQAKYPNIIRCLEAFLHKRMKLILGNSQKVVDQLIEDEKCNPAQTKLIYNGMRQPKMRGHNIRGQFNIGADEVVMTQVANLIPYKGYQDLIKACGLLPKDIPWKLLIVGADTKGYCKTLMELVSAEGLSERIIFTGQSEAVADIYAASDIGILASHEEGFSNAILEGMAASLPMVVTQVGGNDEAVVDFETGRIVPAKDPKALADALLCLLQDASIRESYGGAGYERLQQKFSHQVCVEAYDEVYRNLMSR